MQHLVKTNGTECPEVRNRATVVVISELLTHNTTGEVVGYGMRNKAEYTE